MKRFKITGRHCSPTSGGRAATLPAEGMSESSSRGYTKIRDIGSGPGERLPVGDSIGFRVIPQPKDHKDHKDPKGPRISRGYQGDDNIFLILNSYSLQRQLWQAAMARPFWCRREGMGMCWTLDES